MAIAITHPLLPVHFSRNAIEIAFNAPDKFITQGSFYIRLLLISAYPDTDGDELEFAWERDGVSYTRTFTFRTTPDVELLEILKYPGSEPAGWIQTYLIPGLQADPQLANDFIVNYYDDTSIIGVQLRAQFYDETEGEFTATGFTITNALPFSGAVPEAQPFYRFSGWLYLSRSSESETWDRTGEIELDASSNGTVQLNLQRYADDLINTVETPTDITNAPVLCSQINRRAYVLYGQKWGEILERKKNFRTAEIRILKGGINPRDFADQKADLVGFLGGRFLTLRERRHIKTTIKPIHKDWLYWHCDLSISLTLTVTLHFLDIAGEYQELTYNQWSGFSAIKGRTYQMRVDRNALGTLPGTVEELLSYEISLNSHSQKILFIVDDDHQDIIFEYENTFGARESWKFKGDRQAVATVNKIGYRTALPFNATPEDTDLHTFGELVGQNLNISTGPLSKSDALAFADFARSRHRWLISNNNDRIPARILNLEAVLDSLNLQAAYDRGVSFTVELGVAKGVSNFIL